MNPEPDNPAKRDEPQRPREEDLGHLIQQTVEQTISAFVERNKTLQTDAGEPASSGSPAFGFQPAMISELSQERKKREQLEKRVNELVEEGRRAREMAEQADRFATIKSELQQLGVSKVELAFRAVRDDIRRAEDGKLYAQAEEGSVPLRDFLGQWVVANPEFKPARIAGGAGSSPSRSGAAGVSSFELERIRPGMSAEEMERARQEINRVAAHALGGHSL